MAGPAARRSFPGRLPGYGRQALALLRTPRFAARLLRVIGREWSAGGMQALVSYTGRIMAAGAAAREAETTYREWIAVGDTLTDADRAAVRRHIAALARRPLISVVVPVYNTAEPLLRAMIGSVLAQLYADWELCIADDASPSPHVARVLAEYAAADPRIRWVRRETNGHICAASNTALALARGEFVALLDHDDLLPERALYEIAVALDAQPDADVVYSDEDKLDEGGERYGPYFKPDFSPDLLLGQNMVSHFGVYRKAVLDAVGGFREGYEGSQDYDLALRVVAHCGAARVRHVPAVLYHWRQERAGRSFSQSQLERCVSVARRALQEHVDRAAARGDDAPGSVVPNPLVPTWSRVVWALPDPAPLVSIVVPARGSPERLSACIDGVLRRTDYAHVEVLLVDDGSREAALPAPPVGDARVRVLRHPGPAGDSALNNVAARHARGEVLLLLSPEVEVVAADWLAELVGTAMRPGVGVVGAKLLLADGRIRHAGMRLGPGTAGGRGIAWPLGHLREGTDPGYFGQYALARDVSAVTGACLAIRREVYEQVGGLDEENLPDAFNDVDLCLRVRAAGYRVVWTPFARLRHRDPAAHGADREGDDRTPVDTATRAMQARWGSAIANDPFYSINFDPGAGDCRLAPRRRRPWEAWLPPSG